MTAIQPQLALPRTPGEKPAVDAAEVDRFILWLAGKGWMHRRAIEQATDCGWDERRLRALAEASGGHIISGARGYRLTCEADPQERTECVGRLRGQCVAMTRRRAQIWKVHTRGLVPRCLR